MLANDNDLDGDTLTITVTVDPANGTLVMGATGGFTYTPDADFAGVDTFEYRIDDGNGANDTATVTITLAPVNDAPDVEFDTYSVDEDDVLTVDAANGVLANDGDVDGDMLTASLSALPSNGSLTLNPDGSFTYTPDPDFNGIDSFDYNANDGNGATATITATIAVVPTNDAPIGVDDLYAAEEDTPLIIPTAFGVVSNDIDIDGDTLTIDSSTSTSNGTLSLNSDGSFEYTPNANYTGMDSFTYVATDGIEVTMTVTVTIDVRPENDAPTVIDHMFTTNEDVPLVVPAPGLLTGAMDTEGDTLFPSVVADPSNGTVVVNADGSFTYTPNENYNGPDSFTYWVTDGLDNSNVATVSITVDAVNDAPVAVDDFYTVNEDDVLTVDQASGALSNDTDVEGSTLVASLFLPPSNGMVNFANDGSFTYTPDGDFVGLDSFEYRISDGELQSTVATIEIDVLPVNDVSIATADTYTTDEDTTLTVDAADGVLDNDIDIDCCDTLEAVLVTDVSNGTLTLNDDGSFEYTPSADYNGPDSFEYQIDDGTELSNTVTVDIDVLPVNDAPVADDEAYTTTEDTLLTVAAPGVLDGDTDIEGDALTARLDTDASNGTVFVAADGSISYQPDFDFNGTDTFTYVANDGALDSAPATVTITVDPANDVPATLGDVYDVDEDATLLVDAANGVLSNDTDVDGDAFNGVLVDDVSNGTLLFNADGSFEYTPTADFNGTDTFTLHGQTMGPVTHSSPRSRSPSIR